MIRSEFFVIGGRMKTEQVFACCFK